jgi:hypothetical protein
MRRLRKVFIIGMWILKQLNINLCSGSHDSGDCGSNTVLRLGDIRKANSLYKVIGLHIFQSKV